MEKHIQQENIKHSSGVVSKGSQNKENLLELTVRTLVDTAGNP
jgi:hypothetical protein